METIIAILVIIGVLGAAGEFVKKNKERISEILSGAIGCGIIGAIAAAFLANLASIDSVNVGAIALVSGLLGLVATIAEGAKPSRSNVSTHRYQNLPKLKDPAGYVYLIQEVDYSRQYKIGRTIDPKTRLKQVDIKTPGDTKVIALLKTKDAKTLEKQLHKKYASKRKRGEWFDLTDTQVREICNL